MRAAVFHDGRASYIFFAELQSRIAAVKEKHIPANVAKQRLPIILSTLNSKMQEYNERRDDEAADACSRSILRQQVLQSYTDLHRHKTVSSLPQTTGMLRGGDAGTARALHSALRYDAHAAAHMRCLMCAQGYVRAIPVVENNWRVIRVS
jgi:hypothetical protein